MRDRLLSITQDDLADLSDVMFLAWRDDFIHDDKTNEYIHKRDQLLEEIAQHEDGFNAKGFDEMSDEQFDHWIDVRSKYVIQLFGARYGAAEYSSNFEEQVHSLATIAEGLGWEMALNEVNKRFSNRLKINKEKRGRHWKRANYFHTVKDYSEVLLQGLFLDDINNLRTTKLAPMLGLKSIEFNNQASWMRAMGLVMHSPSDVDIFYEFNKVMSDRSHKHYNLFYAVNSQTDMLLLGSTKALERSLAAGRKK